MSGRNKTGLFVPDERGLGGAMEIAEEYRHFFSAPRTLTRCNATSDSNAGPGPSAQQLSYQRYRKQATSDTVAHDHLVRLSHMFHRVAAPSSSLSQHTAGSQQLGRLHQLRPQSVTADLCPWKPKSCSPEYRPRPKRPSTAPEQRSSRSTAVPRGSGSSTPRDWQQLKAAAHPHPHPPLESVQLPPSRYYPGPNLLPSVQHRLYKAALMAGILQRQLYRAADIRQLCVDFIHSNPAEQRTLLRQVAAEVLHELEVPYTSELDS